MPYSMRAHLLTKLVVDSTSRAPPKARTIPRVIPRVIPRGLGARHGPTRLRQRMPSTYIPRDALIPWSAPAPPLASFDALVCPWPSCASANMCVLCRQVLRGYYASLRQSTPSVKLTSHSHFTCMNVHLCVLGHEPVCRSVRPGTIRS